MTNKEKILARLRNDEDYYGSFGQQYLSNSNIETLLTNPLLLRQPQPPNINFAIGGYFHTLILEPEKLEKYKVIEATTSRLSQIIFGVFPTCQNSPPLGDTMVSDSSALSSSLMALK